MVEYQAPAPDCVSNWERGSRSSDTEEEVVGAQRCVPSTASIGKTPAKVQSTSSNEVTPEAAAKAPSVGPTTLMLRNVPNDLLRDTLCKIMNNQGLSGLYNFVYLPMDFLR